MQLPYDLAIVLEHYTREMKTSFKNLYMNVHFSFICNRQKMETTQPLVSETNGDILITWTTTVGYRQNIFVPQQSWGF